MPTSYPKKSRNGHGHGWGCPQLFFFKTNILFQHSSRDDVCTSASSSDFASKFKAAFSAQANLKPVNLKTSSSSTAAAASDRVITAELDVDGSKYVLDREVLRLETFCDRVAQVTGVDKTKLIKYSYIFDNDTFMFTANESFGLETFLGRRVTCFSIHTKGTGSRQNSGCRKARPTEKGLKLSLFTISYCDLSTKWLF